MSEWKPGWVVNMHRQAVRLKEGQVWAYFSESVDMLDPEAKGILPLRVISMSPTGEVVLRCPRPELVDQTFPLKETTFKGKATMTRDCPFMVVEKAKGDLQTWDLLANEAWLVWGCMHNHTDPPKPGELPFRVEKC